MNREDDEQFEQFRLASQRDKRKHELDPFWQNTVAFCWGLRRHSQFHRLHHKLDTMSSYPVGRICPFSCTSSETFDGQQCQLRTHCNITTLKSLANTQSAALLVAKSPPAALVITKSPGYWGKRTSRLLNSVRFGETRFQPPPCCHSKISTNLFRSPWPAEYQWPSMSPWISHVTNHEFPRLQMIWLPLMVRSSPSLWWSFRCSPQWRSNSAAYLGRQKQRLGMAGTALWPRWHHISYFNNGRRGVPLQNSCQIPNWSQRPKFIWFPNGTWVC